MESAYLTIFLAVVLVTTLLSALNLALGQTSISQLHRRFARSGRERAADWIAANTTPLEHSVAFYRTFGRLTALLLMLEVLHQGVPTRLPLPDVLTALVLAGTVLWATSTVAAGAIARYAGVPLITTFHPLLVVIFWSVYPILWLGRGIDEAVRRLFLAMPLDERAEQDLMHTITDTARAGGIDPLAATIIRNAVEFRNTVVAEVMTPRTQIEGIAYTDDIMAIRAFIATAGHSRIPVYEGSFDNVVGILYVKDLVRLLGTPPDGFVLRPLLRQPPRVPESKAVSDLLIEFQRTEVHLALVVDEFGGTAGLVTIEDVLEEIVGEIYDEHEPNSEIEPVIAGNAESGWQVDGRIPVETVAAETGLLLPPDDGYSTIAGLLLSHFGRIPQIGETFAAYGGRFTVTSATPTRVASVHVEAVAVERD
ncbi:MAG: HlyC/CorC family transporter [Planctomycetes bacterium]|nr:HlyC/CorC family transporter [Planctomycetota bacterium]